MPSNQQQIIEQAKFTYSPLGKGFEKQTKTIEDHVEKQIKVTNQKHQLNQSKNLPMVLMEKEIYNKLTEESFEKINNLDKNVDTGKLLFRYKGNTADQDFSRFDNALDLIDKIKEGKISLTEAKDEQARLKLDMGEIKRVQKTFAEGE